MSNGKGKVAKQFWLSKRAISLPISFLMLFVSLTVIVSATYYVSVAKIQTRGKILNIAVAKQSMLSFENSIGLVKWSPGSLNIYHFEDSGGILKIEPDATNIFINLTDNNTFFEVIFNSSVGKVFYEFPSAEMSVSRLYMKGDKQAVINQTVFTMTQLYLSADSTLPGITLTYRPLATISETGFNEGKPVNTLRIYIVNLNASATLEAIGDFNIRAKCLNVTSNVKIHNFTSQPTSIFVEVASNGRNDMVALPVSSNVEGAFLKVETLVCYVELKRVQGAS